MLLMNAAGERLIAIAGPKAGGFPFHDLDWDRALGLAENLTRFPGGKSAISFLDAGLILRCLFKTSERRALARHLVLPAEGAMSTSMFNMMGARNTLNRFSAARFVPALLTYSERPLKIAVLHSDPVKAERFRAGLQHHAPWHDVVLATDEAQHRSELMIAIGRQSRERAMSRRFNANLTIVADVNLPRLGE
jgi:UDP-N-acetyl-D-mannosaminuronic acid transferase (WecB/TagA/CpsF family)